MRKKKPVDLGVGNCKEAIESLARHCPAGGEGMTPQQVADHFVSVLGRHEDELKTKKLTHVGVVLDMSGGVFYSGEVISLGSSRKEARKLNDPRDPHHEFGGYSDKEFDGKQILICKVVEEVKKSKKKGKK